ncbi:MAG: hypothetical protein JWP75_1220 [Frondihabitans sp.]|nr:hypothetical protein [Frondihabitans sp.]
MEPVAYWRALRKSWIVIVVLMIVGLAVGFGIGKVLPDSYKATTSVFVSATQGSSTTELQQSAVFIQAQVQSYAELATTPAVLRPVIDDLHLDTTSSELAKQVSASNPLNTVIVQITVEESTGAQAARIANSVSTSLRTVASALAPQTQAHTPAIQMSIVTPAQTPPQPSSPDRHVLDLVGLVIGLVLGIAFALIRAGIDTRIHSEQDVEQLTDSPVIGRVQRPAQRDSLILRDAPTAPSAEDYRRIQATLPFAGIDGPVRSLIVTSPSSQEERTTFAVNLAMSSAERSQRVLLIDADLRDAGIGAVTTIVSTHGLVDVLSGTTSLEQAVVSWHGVDVLVAGTIPSNPNVVLGAPALASLLAEARQKYDFIVVNTPPLLPYADALAVVRETDGALVLASGKHTTRQQLLRTLNSLDGVKATTIGVVLIDSTSVVRAARVAGHAEAPSLHGEATHKEPEHRESTHEAEPHVETSAPDSEQDEPAPESDDTADATSATSSRGTSARGLSPRKRTVGVTSGSPKDD